MILSPFQSMNKKMNCWRDGQDDEIKNDDDDCFFLFYADG